MYKCDNCSEVFKNPDWPDWLNVEACPECGCPNIELIEEDKR